MIKNLFDKILALFLIILFSPIYIIVSFLIFFKMGNPILFRQKRPGYKEKIFGIYKFRTMTNEKDVDGNLLPDDQRLVGIGKFIRSTSLDELPQLFNVIKGEMSFVGPRPLLIEYLDLYNDKQKRRHDVKPGITGWAQVNGRNAISWEQKFEYDVWYVDNQSFLLDIKIFWMTFLKVVKRSDITSLSSVTMEKFKGTDIVNNSIYIYGASGHGLVVADIARACGYENIIFIDDGNNQYLSFENIKNNNKIPISLGIGNNNIRAKLFEKLEKYQFQIKTLIHPSVVISSSIKILDGTVVMPNVVINAKVFIGKGVILNTGSIIEHECIIEDFVHISPKVALAGNVKIGKFSHIGMGSNIIQGIIVGNNSIIGAGSTVVKNINNYKKAYGTPCIEIEDINE